jgi:hypothetical protein
MVSRGLILCDFAEPVFWRYPAAKKSRSPFTGREHFCRMQPNDEMVVHEWTAAFCR